MVQRVALHPKPRPRFIEPMECKRVPKLPEGDAWVYEPIDNSDNRELGIDEGKIWI